MKKKANISNILEIIKLFKKQKNYVVNLSRKVKAKYFQNHTPHSVSSEYFWKFTNRSFQIKRKFWRQNNKEEKVEKVSENEDVANHFNNDFNFVNSDPTKKTNCAIPTKIVKLGNKQMYYDLVNCINACINQSKFPNQLK